MVTVSTVWLVDLRVTALQELWMLTDNTKREPPSH